MTSNNRERYLFFDAAPIRNAEGEIVAVIETVQDITERRRMEELASEKARNDTGCSLNFLPMRSSSVQAVN